MICTPHTPLPPKRKKVVGRQKVRTYYAWPPTPTVAAMYDVHFSFAPPKLLRPRPSGKCGTGGQLI